MKKAFALVAVAGIAAAASAQSIIIDIDDDTLAPGETTTVTMSASYGGTDYAIAGVATSLIGGGDNWSDMALIAPMDGPGTSAGAGSGNGVDGVIAGQLNFPPAGIYADDTNPIAFWSATYTASAEGVYDLVSETTKFDTYIAMDSSTSESRLADLTEGSGTITVIPAPASLALLGLGGLAAARRRR